MDEEMDRAESFGPRSSDSCGQQSSRLDSFLLPEFELPGITVGDIQDIVAEQLGRWGTVAFLGYGIAKKIGIVLATFLANEGGSFVENSTIASSLAFADLVTSPTEMVIITNIIRKYLAESFEGFPTIDLSSLKPKIWDRALLQINEINEDFRQVELV